MIQRGDGNGDTPCGLAKTSYNANIHRGNTSYGNHSMIYCKRKSDKIGGDYEIENYAGIFVFSSCTHPPKQKVSENVSVEEKKSPEKSQGEFVGRSRSCAMISGVGSKE